MPVSQTLLVDFPRAPRTKSKYQCPTSKDKKKSVRISSTSSLHRYHYTKFDDGQEPISTWHGKQDYSTFRRTAKKEAAKLRKQFDDVTLVSLSLGVPGDRSGQNNSIHEDLAIITRGLEHLLYEPTLDKLVSTRTNHKDAVLEEQWRQFQMSSGDIDQLSLKKVSKMYSSWGKKRAIALAGGSWQGASAGVARRSGHVRSPAA